MRHAHRRPLRICRACSNEQLRLVVCFLTSEEVELIKIDWRMKSQCSDACLFSSMCTGQVDMFLIVTAGTDRPGAATANIHIRVPIAGVESVLTKGRRVTVNEMAALLAVSHGSTHGVIREFMKFYKAYANWAPRELKQGSLKQQPLRSFEARCRRIVTADETWTWNHNLGTKRESVERCIIFSPKRKFRTQPCVEKLG